jgi:hypothetical protein
MQVIEDESAGFDKKGEKLQYGNKVHAVLFFGISPVSVFICGDACPAQGHCIIYRGRFNLLS